MDKEFIPYEQALALKGLGFDEPCFGLYHNDKTLRLDINANQSIKFHEHLGRFKGCIIAPLYQQAFRWFREKHDLQYNIVWNKFYDKTPYEYEVRPTWRDEPLRPYGTSGMCNTYEEAELACLIKLIELIK